MMELPLLLFSRSPDVTKSTKGRPNPHQVNRPTAERQLQRLNPAFQQLQDSFSSQGAELQATSSGIDPEQVLVLETIGSVEEFANAVKKIEGLEWMGEYEIDDISPDEDFQDIKKPEKDLSGRLYLTMSNQTGLNQMLSLWRRYAGNPDTMNFKKGGEYYGLAKFRDVFLRLKDIRRWGVEDRLAEREVFERWSEDLEFDPQINVRFEAELWFRGSTEKRRESEGNVSELIWQLGGRVISKCVLESIAYHSILGEIPAEKARHIMNQPEVELVQCQDIMFFRPTGQIATGKGPVEVEVSDCQISSTDLPSGDPVVAVLDGLPLENHKLLEGRLIVDDPDDWASAYKARARQHGTAMTSLIVHGDLNDSSNPLSRPVYVRPIMKPVEAIRSTEEKVPDDLLLVDYMHRAVKRIMEGEADEEAVAPTVKIINLSIGDSSRHFSQEMSPLARLVDWLSAKYSVLFVISSGNHTEPINTGLSNQDFEALEQGDREALVVQKIYDENRHRRLLSPAESINGITVGAFHHDSSRSDSNSLVDVFESNLPSPVSAFGTGYRRAIKPDLLFSGGRVVYRNPLGTNNVTLAVSGNRPLGNRVATFSAEPGDLNKSKLDCGTSNSAALVSRVACIYYDYLVRIFSEQAPNEDFAPYVVPILKAMVLHGCSWNEMGNRLDNLLKKQGEANKSERKKLISKWIGYGVPEVDKALGCNAQRATVIGYGELKDNEAHVYHLPLPPSLHSKRAQKKFTVTLAWLSRVASTSQRYREAKLWFDFEEGDKSRKTPKGILGVGRTDSDYNATQRGTVQHEVFEGKNAIDITDGDTLRIRVNCKGDARKVEHPVAYGLVVSLEVAEGIDLPIYNEVETRISTPISIRTTG